MTPAEDRTYAERLATVETALQSRWPETEIEPDLSRMRMLVDLLGDPQHAAPVIHVTGTNGKTSTARITESLLRTFGLRPGVFTSPHLHSMRERIRIDAETVPVATFVEAYEELAPYLELVDARLADAGGNALTYFEVITALAFSIFADAPVDVVVLEVGLGGRWDATNVADGEVAVITAIAHDHEQFLGHTIEEIAYEKAGIIKAGSTVIVAQQPPEAAEVLLRAAADVEAEVAREGLEFAVVNREVAVGGQVLTLQGLGGTYDDVFLSLMGRHQAHNAVVALAAVEAFLGGGRMELLAENVREAFASVVSPGRLEVVKRSPTVLVDAAHNPAGAASLAAALDEDFSFGYLIGVIAVMADKDVEGVLEALEGIFNEVVVTVNSSPRSATIEALQHSAVEVFGADRVHTAARLDEALARAVELVDAVDPEQAGGTGVVVTGSVVTVADVRTLLGA